MTYAWDDVTDAFLKQPEKSAAKREWAAYCAAYWQKTYDHGPGELSQYSEQQWYVFFYEHWPNNQ